MTEQTHSPYTPSLRIWLQGESTIIAAVGIWVYAQTGAGWWLFAACALLPDLAMLGYAFGPRWGARAYNVAHSYATPLALGAGAALAGAVWAGPLVCIWLVHIAVDRAVGYGLKYPGSFKATHLDAV